MKPSKLIRILVLPVGKYDRRNVAEVIENESFTIEALTEKFEDAQILELTDFMDLCNNEELNLDGCWISYVNIVSE
jgi:hypothetical protein